MKRVFTIEKGCGACGGCAEVCPADAVIITPTGGYADFSIDPDKCEGCGACAGVCPFDSIKEA